MKKRTAEKVISRSILGLATYRKSTMGRAMVRRPSFWTVSRDLDHETARPRKRLRLEFGETGGPPPLTMDYDDQSLATPRGVEA